MAFRRRAAARRSFRRKRKWDMQEFRECNRIINIDTSDIATCENPFILADLIASPGSNQTGVLQSAGAGNGVMWGGFRGQIQYFINLTLEFDSVEAAICNLPIFLMTALVRLPIDPAQPFLPTYLPNLIQSHSQLSNTFATQSDNVESILWRRFEQLQFSTFQFCSTDETTCWPARTDTQAQLCGTTRPADGDAWISALGTALGNYGRTQNYGWCRGRTKRRLDERTGIFLVRNIHYGSPGGIEDGPIVTLRSEAWLSFALRRL